MDGLSLLCQARSAGLEVQAKDGKLVIRGPRRAESIANELLARKIEIMPLLARSACVCNPPPSQAEYGAMAQAGCGPDHERCDACGYRWQCKLCGGCRRCRTQANTQEQN